MREDLRQLLQVQELDIEIRDLVGRKISAVRGLKALRIEIENDEKALKEEKTRLMGSRVDIKELELEIAEKRGHINKYREQLFKVKNNKEYTALLHEVAKVEADISILDPDLYETYEIVFSRKPDRAIVKVSNDACGGCNMELRAQELNDLYREDIINRCENCGRFLYI